MDTFFIVAPSALLARRLPSLSLSFLSSPIPCRKDEEERSDKTSGRRGKTKSGLDAGESGAQRVRLSSWIFTEAIEQAATTKAPETSRGFRLLLLNSCCKKPEPFLRFFPPLALLFLLLAERESFGRLRISKKKKLASKRILNLFNLNLSLKKKKKTLPEPTLTASAADRLGANFHPAPAGVTCDAACASFAGGLSPLSFNEFGESTTGRTALCSALRKDGTRAAGFQILSGGASSASASAGQPTCTIVDGSASVEATDYACACLDSSKQVQGLQRPTFGARCASTCATSLLGDTGRPVAVGAGAAAKGDHACLAMGEQGGQNRFGSEIAPGACVGGRDGGVAFGSDSFSCVCVYDRPAAKAAGPKTSSGKGVDAGVVVATERRTFDKELVKPAVVSVASTSAAPAVDDP